MANLVLDALAIALALLCSRTLFTWQKRRAKRSCLPPGPKGLPIIGSVFDMPKENEFETVRQWSREYGDLVYVKAFGSGYLFLNSFEAAIGLLEKRSSNFSNRPQMTMLVLEGWSEWFFSAMPYGDYVRQSRRHMNKFFNQISSRDHYEVQRQTTHKLLSKLLENPDDFQDHIRFFASELIIKIVYGFDIVENDPYVEILEAGMQAASEALFFFTVNALPILRHLPPWLPGATFHTVAKEGREALKAMYHEPYKKARTMMADGKASPSIISKLLDVGTVSNVDDTYETLIARLGAVIFSAGGDTTISALLTFTLATVLYPETMRKAHEELDRVIGRDTLPTFEDRSRLPYIEAICTECLRWQPVAPLGVPHLAEEDDIYNDYFIPAGTIVFGNIWAMLRDPRIYSNPDKFIPERWLFSDGGEPLPDVDKMAFGFGKRICPGRFFAENTIFIAVASILAVFDIQKAVGKDGVPITPSEDYTSGLVRHPKPFKCKIIARSEEVAAAVREAVS